MDTRRIILFAAFALVIMTLFQKWEQYQYDKNPPVVETAATGGLSVPSSPTPSASDVDIPSTPSTQAVVATPSVSETVVTTGELINVTTDLVQARINTLGGSIEYVGLSAHPLKLDQPADPVVLMQNSARERYVGQSGLTGDSSNLPNHNTQYTVSQSDYVLGDADSSLEVNLNWTSTEGVDYIKTYTFSRDSYRADVKFSVVNNSAADWSAYFYGQLQRTDPERTEGGNILTRPMPSFTGGAYYTPEEHYNKVSFSDMEDDPLRFEAESGWVGMLQHYFVSAWLPKDDEKIQIFSSSSRGTTRENYKIGFLGLSELRLAPGQSGELGAALYSGPKEQVRLDKQNSEGLKLTVDYGWLTVIAQPLFWVMSKLYDLLGNWGWAIIGVTVLIKLVFLPLSAKSYKSMAKMKKLAPRLKTLKERHGDDKQKYQAAMMDLYKKEKINPASGCLPILIQIPVFIALYWVLLESVEMRQAPWALWIQDLSSKDPYYILPLLMGGSMFVQQLLNPAPMDPMQQKIMMALPVVFTVFFLSFPAGLVLYWVVNNSLSILQQWLITRRYA
jgi:YidC/Oxa1 family membrane protein insertase